MNICSKKRLIFCITINIISLRGDEMAKIGRPKGYKNLEYVYTIRLDEETYNRLETYCKILNMHKSEVIRDAINEKIRERGMKYE